MAQGFERFELSGKHCMICRWPNHGGYEVKTMGDGFMLAFRSAKEGLDCAIAIQRALAAESAAGHEHIRVPHRPARRRGDQGRHRLLRQEREPRLARRRPGEGRRNPGVVAAPPAGREQHRRRDLRRAERGGAEGNERTAPHVRRPLGVRKEGRPLSSTPPCTPPRPGRSDSPRCRHRWRRRPAAPSGCT
jgi:hypothetical protein